MAGGFACRFDPEFATTYRESITAALCTCVNLRVVPPLDKALVGLTAEQRAAYAATFGPAFAATPGKPGAGKPNPPRRVPGAGAGAGTGASAGATTPSIVTDGRASPPASPSAGGGFGRGYRPARSPPNKRAASPPPPPSSPSPPPPTAANGGGGAPPRPGGRAPSAMWSAGRGMGLSSAVTGGAAAEEPVPKALAPHEAAVKAAVAAVRDGVAVFDQPDAASGSGPLVDALRVLGSPTPASHAGAGAAATASATPADATALLRSFGAYLAPTLLLRCTHCDTAAARRRGGGGLTSPRSTPRGAAPVNGLIDLARLAGVTLTRHSWRAAAGDGGAGSGTADVDSAAASDGGGGGGAAAAALQVLIGAATARRGIATRLLCLAGQAKPQTLWKVYRAVCSGRTRGVTPTSPDALGACVAADLWASIDLDCLAATVFATGGDAGVDGASGAGTDGGTPATDGVLTTLCRVALPALCQAATTGVAVSEDLQALHDAVVGHVDFVRFLAEAMPSLHALQLGCRLACGSYQRHPLPPVLFAADAVWCLVVGR